MPADSGLRRERSGEHLVEPSADGGRYLAIAAKLSLLVGVFGAIEVEYFEG